MIRLLFLIFCIPLYAIDSDAHRFVYKDELRITDRRRIAICAYDSVILQPICLSLKSEFVPSSLYFPVSLSHISKEKRLTYVIDPAGNPKRLWIAESAFTYLPNARNNLAAQVGCSKIVRGGRHTGYDLNEIGYIKKLGVHQMVDANEVLITSTWVMRSPGLPYDTAAILAQWAEDSGFTAVIWHSLPSNITQGDALNALLTDEELLGNTQAYLHSLLDAPQATFERAILRGREILSTLKPKNEMQYDYFAYYQEGNLPILLTAPHGGKASIGVSQRRNYGGVWDEGTLELAMKISEELFKLTGAYPYIVAANFSRKEIDANRSAMEAYEDRRAQPIYDFYHNTIDRFIRTMNERFNDRTILIDIHGQGTEASTIFRGTQDRSTVRRLLSRDGERALTGKHSILGTLADLGYRQFPKITDRFVRENRHYNGGWTVRQYSTAIDALQLELGWNLRHDSISTIFAQDLAQALVKFYKEYLKS